MPVKPGFWLASQAAVDPHYRMLWEGLYTALPLLESDYVAGIAESPVNYGDGSPVQITAADVAGTEMAVVETPYGTGLEWLAGADTGDGIRVEAGPFALNGTTDYTAAVMFKWDGTTGDERAILSQVASGGPGLRLRIANEASPADLLMISTPVLANAIVADNWYLYVQRSRPDGVDVDKQWFLQNFTADSQLLTSTNSTGGSFGDEDEHVYFGANAANDPAVGVTIAGCWLWDRRLGGGDVGSRNQLGELELFIADPFGMFRPALWPGFPTLPGGATLQYLYPDGDLLSGGWDTQPTPGQSLFSQIDEDPAVDSDYIHEDV